MHMHKQIEWIKKIYPTQYAPSVPEIKLHQTPIYTHISFHEHLLRQPEHRKQQLFPSSKPIIHIISRCRIFTTDTGCVCDHKTFMYKVVESFLDIAKSNSSHYMQHKWQIVLTVTARVGTHCIRMIIGFRELQ